MIKIAMAGNMRAGKDTCADYIKEKYLNNAKTYSFAEPLYDLLYMTQDYLNIERKKERNYLQFIGDYGRQINPTIWIDKLITKLDTTCPILITDARYYNELIRLKEEGFIIIRVLADETIRIKRGAMSLTHKSELEFDLFTEYDYIIDNNSTFNNLYKQLDAIIIKYM